MRIAKLWHKSTEFVTRRHKWANIIGKMVLTDLSNVKLPHKHSLEKNGVSAKLNKTRYACTSEVLLRLFTSIPNEFLSSLTSTLLTHQCLLSCSLVYALMGLYLVLAKYLILQAYTLSITELACVNKWKTMLSILLEIGNAKKKGKEVEASKNHLSPD